MFPVTKTMVSKIKTGHHSYKGTQFSEQLYYNKLNTLIYDILYSSNLDRIFPSFISILVIYSVAICDFSTENITNILFKISKHILLQYNHHFSVKVCFTLLREFFTHIEASPAVVKYHKVRSVMYT